MKFAAIREIMFPVSFEEWLVIEQDALPTPEAFSEWLEQNQGSLDEPESQTDEKKHWCASAHPHTDFQPSETD
jgi:hypothetical protein